MRTRGGVIPTYQTVICFLVDCSPRNAHALAKDAVSSIFGHEIENIDGFEAYWKGVSVYPDFSVSF